MGPPRLDSTGGDAWGGASDAYIYTLMENIKLTQTDSTESSWDFALEIYYDESNDVYGNK